MHSLTLVFGPQGTTIQFLFSKREDAMKMLAASKNTADDLAVIEDDFGQHAEIKISGIHARCVEDLAMSGDAVIERSLQNAKTQHKGNNRAANDPALRLLNGGMALNHPGAPAGAMRRPI